MRGRFSVLPLLGLLVLITPACDQARLRDGGELSQTPVIQPVAMRGLVTARGLESLYRTAAPQGLRIEAEPLSYAHQKYTFIFGPIDETIAVERWNVTTATPQIDVRASLNRPALNVALRIHDGVAYQICRYALTLTDAAIVGSVEMVDRGDGPVLDLAERADVEAADIDVRLLGNCPLGLDFMLTEETSLGDVLENYVVEALSASAEAAFAASPLDMMGLIRRRAELVRVSPYASRRGQVLLIGQLSESESGGISAQGLEVSMDVAMSPRRAGCAPPVGLAIPDTVPAAPVTATSLNQFGADVGFSLSVPLLERIAQSTTLAGFMCQGFDDGRRDEESRDAIAVENLRPGDIGLDLLPLGPWGRVMFSPTELPTVQSRPERSDVLLRLPGFTMEVYGELHGVPVRLASSRATVELGLRPRAEGMGLIGFDVETVQVRDVELTSDWLATQPANEDVLRWTRRLLLMTLQNRLVLPLPIEPGTPLTLVGSQIRSNDVVLMMRFTP